MMVKTIDRHVPKIEVQEVIRHVPKIEVQVQERVIEHPQIHHVEKIVEVPQTVVQVVNRHVPKVHVQEILKHVPKIDVQVQERIIEVPQVQVVEKLVEVPQVQIQEVVKHVPKAIVQEVIRHVPKVEIQTVERTVEVPHVQTVEKVVEVPRVHVQEIVKHVKVPVIETREVIVEVPCVQVQEKIVEHPDIHVQEVTRHVPKIVEVQEIVKNVSKVDWNASSISGGSIEAPTLPPSTPANAHASSSVQMGAAASPANSVATATGSLSMCPGFQKTGRGPNAAAPTIMLPPDAMEASRIRPTIASDDDNSVFEVPADMVLVTSPPASSSTCPNCGNTLMQDSFFCRRCGHKLHDESRTVNNISRPLGTTEATQRAFQPMAAFSNSCPSACPTTTSTACPTACLSACPTGVPSAFLRPGNSIHGVGAPYAGASLQPAMKHGCNHIPVALPPADLHGAGCCRPCFR